MASSVMLSPTGPTVVNALPAKMRWTPHGTPVAIRIATESGFASLYGNVQLRELSVR